MKQITPHLPEIVEILPIFCPYFSQLIPNLKKFLPFLLKILPHAKPQYSEIWPMLSKMEK